VEAYLAALAEVGLDPEVAFEKDLKLARAKGFKWYFEHGMTLLGSRDDVEEGRVRVPPSNQGPVEIRDTLMRIKGR
jgi:hypothetical protein